MAEKASAAPHNGSPRAVTASYSKIASAFQCVSHVQKRLQTPGSQGLTLWCVNEHFQLILIVLDKLLQRPLPQAWTQLSLVQKLLPPPALAAKTRAIASETRTRLEALSSLLAEWQLLHRLWGVLDLSVATVTVIQEMYEKWRDGERIDWPGKTIEAMQTVSILFFHLFEAGAALAARKVLSFSERTQGKLGLASIRSWMVYTFLDIASDLRAWRKRRQGGDAGLSEAEAEAKRVQWRKQFTRNLALIPVSIHWSVPGGVLPDYMISVLSCYATLSLVKTIFA